MKHKCDSCFYKGEYQALPFRPFGVCLKETDLIKAEEAFNAKECPYKIKEKGHIKPTVYAMSPDKLDDFVHNKASVGDILMSYDAVRNRRLIYLCNEKNIGKDIYPVWMAFDEEELLRNQLRNMTLEEKVDFLLDKYIENEISKR